MTDVSVAPARAIIDTAIGTLCTACVLLVERAGRRETYAAGTLCPDPKAGTDGSCTEASIFDLASLTKLATTALALALARERVIELDMPLREIVPDFRGAGKDRVTIAHVLTHTAGLRWWKPLYQEASGTDEAVWLAAQEPLAREIGTFTYSDLGYVMLTAGLARAGDAPFADLIRERVLGPVDARTCSFGPRPPGECAATEIDATWRRKRLRGEVHDENSYGMGGVAGHAGLFGTAADVAAIARVFRDGAVIGNELAALARREHVRGENARRGLGLALRAPDGPMCGQWFGPDAWGHSGFTGTTLWVDPALDLTVVLLTNRVYFGRDNADELYRFRIAVHEAVSEPLVGSR
ncbi:MAG: beta-lactamase family protein [Chloroflexi bacterium]|nr:beta-lactamase family protein [Chloroflexota bacterium]MBI2983386.1 beta-lactamase family protein [Chloroflexota bacterium]